jgi:hypothetical protein
MNKLIFYFLMLFAISQARGSMIETNVNMDVIIWGGATNSIRGGVLLGYISNGAWVYKPSSKIALAIGTTDTNGIVIWWPRNNERKFSINLKSTDGKTVERATNGLKDANIPTQQTILQPTQWNRFRYKSLHLSKTYEEMDLSFDAMELFNVKETGIYEMSIEFRVNIQETNGALKSLNLPKLEVPMRVEKDKDGNMLWRLEPSTAPK